MKSLINATCILLLRPIALTVGIVTFGAVTGCPTEDAPPPPDPEETFTVGGDRAENGYTRYEECPLGATCSGGVCTVVDNDIDNDGYLTTVDCDDNDAEIHPGRAEVCDGIDQDCDTIADNGVKNACGTCGEVPVEICDLIDNDCDLRVDEECAGGDVEEHEPNDGSINCQAIALPQTVGDTVVLSGVFDPAGDVDSYCFFVRTGVALTFDVDSVVLGAPTDGVLTLFDEDGAQLPNGHNDFADGPDPRLEYTFASDGLVRLDLFDFYTDRGGPDFIYELAITANALVDCSDVDQDGISPCDGDCNDNDPRIFPRQTEVCDGVDNSCDGVVDEDCPDLVAAEVEPNENMQECIIFKLPFTLQGVIDPRKDKDTFCFFAPDGAVIGFDIDAKEPPFDSLLNSRLRLLGTTAVLLNSNDDGIDPNTGFTGNNSDSYLEHTFLLPGVYAIEVSDESTVVGGSRLTYTLRATQLVSPPCTDGDEDGVSTCEGDCEDGEASVHFGAREVCDGRDNDCDGVGDPAGCTGDFDGDGFAGRDGDCDDDDRHRFPGATEVCNGVDDDCDDEVDEGVVNACGTCGHAPPERCGDGIDNDCDLTVDTDCAVDVDNDGVTPDQGDCDDNNSAIRPSAIEVCNGVDDDCDGFADEFVKNACGECAPAPVEVCDGVDDDCDGRVADGAVNACVICGPAPVDICDGRDNNCDGVEDDGVLNACGECGPVPPEACDGEDNNCDGFIDEGCDVDVDGDGLTLRAGDCDDSVAAIHFGATEVCDGVIDHDCDGVVDDGCPTPAESEVNDSFNTCDTLRIPGLVTGTISTATDVDVFCFTIPVVGMVVGFDVDARDEGSPLDALIELIGPSGTVIASNTNAVADPDSGLFTVDPYLTHEFTETGSFAVRVRAQVTATAGATSTYAVDARVIGGCVDLDRDRLTTCDGDCNDFNASIHPGAVDVCDSVDNNCVDGADEFCVGTCLDDQLEQNDTAPSARSVLPSSLTALRFCRGDSDFYSFAATTGQAIRVDALFTHAQIDLTLRLLRPDGTQAAISATSTNNESVTHTATQTGTYFIEVTGPLNQEGSYELVLAVTP